MCDAAADGMVGKLIEVRGEYMPVWPTFIPSSVIEIHPKLLPEHKQFIYVTFGVSVMYNLSLEFVTHQCNMCCVMSGVTNSVIYITYTETSHPALTEEGITSPMALTPFEPRNALVTDASGGGVSHAHV